MGGTGTEALDAAEVAYEVAQDAGFAYHAAQGARRPDAYRLHCVYDAKWQEYLRLLRVAVAQVHVEQGIKEAAR